jgi:hypothetical protein
VRYLREWMLIHLNALLPGIKYLPELFYRSE